MGNFSRDTFDKLKHYVGVRLQQGVPLVDADWNEQEDIRKYELQAFLKWFVGNGVPKGNDGFSIVSIVNKIILTSNKKDIGLSSVEVKWEKSTAAEALGFGPDNYRAKRVAPPAAQLTGKIAGSFALEHNMTLAISVDDLPPATVTFSGDDFKNISKATAAEVAEAINKAITDLTASSGADNDFDIKGGDGTAEGAGRCLVEGWDAINESNLKYTAQPLFDNAALAAKWGVDRLDPLSPPDPKKRRIDMVYLDVWEREVDEEEDYEHLVNPAIGIETCVRLKREWVVRVAEGKTDSPSPPEGHVFYTLARLYRKKPGEATIWPGVIIDLRRSGLAVLSKELTIKDGNVGIGTTKPETRLHVSEGDILLSNNRAVMFKDKDGANQKILRFDSNNDVTLWNPTGGANDDIFLGTGSIQGANIHMVVKGNGKIGIGTTKPTSLLDVLLGSIRVRRDANQYIQIIDNSKDGGFITGHSRANNKKPLYIESLHDGGEGPKGETQMRFRVGNENSPTTAITIKEDGNVGIGTTSLGRILDVDGQITIRPGSKSNAGIWLTNTSDEDEWFMGKTNIYKKNQIGFWNGHWQMVIEDGGNVGIGTTDPKEKLHIENGNIAFRSPANPQNERLLYFMKTGIGDSTGYKLAWRNDDGSLRKGVIELDRNGQVYFRGGYVGIRTTTPQYHLHTDGWSYAVHRAGGGIDYAEYFESLDGKKIPTGTSVVLDGDKIRPADKNETPIGIISSNSLIVGGVHTEWPKRYLRDEFGNLIMEDYEEEVMVPEKEKVTRERQKVEKKSITEEVTRREISLENGKYIQKEIFETITREVEEPLFEEFDLYDATGKNVIGKHRIPVMETYEEEIEVLDQNGQPVLVGSGEFLTKQRPKLNPDYDVSKKYVSREDRPEWNCVGLLGQLPMRKGRSVGESWIKVKDISDDVELWLVK